MDRLAASYFVDKVPAIIKKRMPVRFRFLNRSIRNNAKGWFPKSLRIGYGDGNCHADRRQLVPSPVEDYADWQGFVCYHELNGVLTAMKRILATSFLFLLFAADARAN